MKNILFPILILTILSCGPSGKRNMEAIQNTGSTDISNIVATNFLNDYTSGVTVQINSDNVAISSTGLPDHTTPYWGSRHEMWDEFPDSNPANMNETMISFNYVMTIPRKPSEAREKEQTELGPVGMAINGVPIYNDYEGVAMLDKNAWSTFDKSGAHTGPKKDYHYHCEGSHISINDSNLFGFIRDGFPIYGRRDKDGSYPNNLDTNGGHIGPTAEFPDGIYHYHMSNEVYSTSDLYVIKAGAYHGTKGTFSN